MNTIEKINKLKEIGFSNRLIEIGSGISEGYISDILKQKRTLKKTTENKIEVYYKFIIKEIVGTL